LDTQAISAITALVAVIVSPIISIYIAKRQVHASVVSANRQKWIDSLRDQLADLITGVHVLRSDR
jgi:ABC-type transport system involved in cytochrome bd biosynthesis fused ATPase/permease subunit